MGRDNRGKFLKGQDMRIAYFDCSAGAAGDMIVAAMLDAGLDLEYLKGQLATLKIKKLDIKVRRTKRAGLGAMTFVPIAPDEHHHRNLKEITAIISGSKIGDKAKKTAIAIFKRLAEAEAKVHRTKPQKIHFHEVGAVDSIVDIVSAAIGLEALGIEKVYCSPMSVGGGTVKVAHGRLPVPAPATAELIKGVPAAGGPINKELLTPTGAAILTTIAEGFCELPAMKVTTIGYGAGTLDCEEFANVVRLIVGEAGCDAEANADTVCLLETNIDDVSGEVVACVMDSVFENGALDVFTSAINMKHNRPAVKMSVICEPGSVQRIEQIIFEAGLTFGIRRQMLQRSKLAREFVTAKTEYGDIRIKVGRWRGKIVNAKPEFADCARAAERCSVPVKAVLEAAKKAYTRRD